MASHAPPHKLPRPGVEAPPTDILRTRRQNTQLMVVVPDT